MRQTKPIGLSAGIFALLFLLAGCVSVEKSFPEKRYYILDVSRQVEAVPSLDGPLLRVRKLRVSPRFEGKGFVYRKGDLSYESDFYNEFLIPPASLLTEEVRQWLTRSGLFQYVTESASQLQPPYILEGAVSALYGDYRDGASLKAALGMQFFLMRDVSARTEIIFRNEYEKEVAISESSPRVLVKGWNEALRQILTALEIDLRRVSLKKGR